MIDHHRRTVGVDELAQARERLVDLRQRGLVRLEIAGISRQQEAA
jgi:hypothetical protein